MPWQRLVADVGGELLDDGTPAYRQVVVTVPRQSGKTTLVLAWELHRALMWGRRQAIAYTAQSGNASREKLIVDQYDGMIARSPLKSSVRQVRRAMGATALVFKNGSRIDALATSPDAGHGRTLDLAVIDEAMADTEPIREQGLRPAMATRKDAQLLIPSTAGTPASVFLKRKVQAGRAAVTSGIDTGIAYFEWSADDDADPYDSDGWHTYMPALGHTIDESVVEADLHGMDIDEFRRAYMNQWTGAKESVIPQEIWDAVQGDIEPAGDIVFAVDASPDHAHGSIVAVDRNLNCAVVDYRPDVGWLMERTLELVNKKGGQVAVDVTGPIGHLAASFTASGVKVEEFAGRRMAQACGFTVSAIADRQIRVRGHDALNKAVAGAVKVPVGDAWRWGRKNADADVSPLVAMTMGLGVYSVNLGEVNVMFI